jgi:acetyltransferase
VLAKKADMRVVGPNCAGIANIVENVILSPVVSYELDTLTRGRIGLVSQSGGLTGSYVARAEARGIGFSYVISTGNEMDLEACDYIEYLLNDADTKVIALFLEGLRNTARFHQVADWALEMGKPIIVLKVGRTQVGSKAAASHTGALTGSDLVYDSVFKQKGVTRVETLEDLLEVSSLFCKTTPPRGNRVAVITTSGGGATLLAEAGAQAGLEFPLPSEEAVAQASKILPRFAAKSNPMDVTMSGVGGGYKKCLEILLEDDTFDMVVGVVGTSSQFAPEMGVKPIVEVYAKTTKPLVAFCSPNAEKALRLFERHGIPSFRTPEACGRALKYLTEYGRTLEKRKKLKDARAEPAHVKPDRQVVERVLGSPKRILDEYESKIILAQYGIPVVREHLAKDLSEAKKIAEKMGYPLALKVSSSDIPHKTEAGVIKLAIDSEDSLEKGFDEIMNSAISFNKDAMIDGVLIQEMAEKGVEVIVGMSCDEQFGPTLVFGLGGIFVDLFQDVALRVLPISSIDAGEMINETKASVLLKGYRGVAQMDIEAIVSTLLKVSQMVTDLKDVVQELDINPLLVYPKGKGVLAVDALIKKK